MGPDNGVACPLLEGRPCRAVEQTDAVVTGLVDSVEGRRILAAIHASHPDRPVLVEGTALMLRHLDEQLRDAPVFPLDPDQVADALDARLGPP